MGFWQSITRMVKGEPVFQASSEQSDFAQESESQEASIQDSPSIIPKVLTETKNSSIVDKYVVDGHKIAPNVLCEHVEWHENGDTREIWARFVNHGETSIFLDKIAWLGGVIQLDYNLASGSDRELKIYSGQKLKSRDYTKAELYIRLPNGDYFCANHEVLYNVKSDGENEVKELRRILPVRDV